MPERRGAGRRVAGILGCAAVLAVTIIGIKLAFFRGAGNGAGPAAGAVAVIDQNSPLAAVSEAARNSDPRVLPGDQVGGLRAAHAGHPEVHQDDVGLVLGGCLDRGSAVADRGHHRVPEVGEQRIEALAEQRVVVGDEHAQRVHVRPPRVAAAGGRRRVCRRPAPS